MPNKKELTYEQAVKRLEAIVGDLERGTSELDLLSSQIKEAQELLAFCQSKLLKVENDVKKLLDDGKE